MATTSAISEQGSKTSLLVNLPSLAHGAHTDVLTKLADAAGGRDIIVALPNIEGTNEYDGLRVVGYSPTIATGLSWTLTAADYVNVYEVARTHSAQSILLLGSEAQSISSEGLRSMIQQASVPGCDLVLPLYSLPPRTGLVNLAILYPVTRSLFSAVAHFPLPIDLAFSTRMAEKLAAVAQRQTASNQTDGLIWPAAEAAAAGFSTVEIAMGSRAIPQPEPPDLNAVLSYVAGSLFADVEAKASFWQRARGTRQQLLTIPFDQGEEYPANEVSSMTEGFRLAYGNLLEIWSIVLPPQSLLGLKRLSTMTDGFFLPHTLWARIVYDFLLAYRLRTLNRGHLLGAFTPLYLAWVASYLLYISAGAQPQEYLEATAAAFEAEKPYFVSRWRWPDRFNP